MKIKDLLEKVNELWKSAKRARETHIREAEARRRRNEEIRTAIRENAEEIRNLERRTGIRLREPRRRIRRRVRTPAGSTDEDPLGW